MSTREHIILICDLCSTTGDSVATHRLGLDSQMVELEACARCFTKAEKTLIPFLDAGRRVARRRRRAA